jgi:hypothetical protein
MLRLLVSIERKIRDYKTRQAPGQVVQDAIKLYMSGR